MYCIPANIWHWTASLTNSIFEWVSSRLCMLIIGPLCILSICLQFSAIQRFVTRYFRPFVTSSFPLKSPPMGVFSDAFSAIHSSLRHSFRWACHYFHYFFSFSFFLICVFSLLFQINIALFSPLHEQFDKKKDGVLIFQNLIQYFIFLVHIFWRNTTTQFE